MTTHRRGFLRRLGVATTIALGVVLLPALPAQAAATVSAAPGSIELGPNDNRSITIQVAADAQGSIPGQVDVNFGGQVAGALKISANGGCEVSGTNVTCNVGRLDPNEDKSFSIGVSANASAVQPGQTLTGQATVKGELGVNGSKTIPITLKGPQAQQSQSPTVTEVSGTVSDITTSTPIGSASVLLKAGDKEKRISTDNNGKFKFVGTAADPIPPGSITVEATKSGFKTATATRNGNANSAVTGLALKLETGSAAASPPPTVEESGNTDPNASDSGAPDLANTAPAANEDGTSMLSWVLIGMGVLLVLLGVGAIVVLLRRNKDDREPEDDFDDGGPHDDRTRVGAVPGSRGAYHGGATDATRVARGGISDAPTEIVRPQAPLDEFPDPYAAPAPTQVGGYPPQGGGYGNGGYNNGGYDDGYGNRGGGGGQYGDATRVGGGGGGGGYGGETRVGGYPTDRGDGGYPQAGGNNYPPQGGQYGGGDYGRGGDRSYEGGYPPQGGGYEPPRAGGYDRGNYERPPQRGRQVNWMDD
ncbi:hypothetical protein Val02_88830 [Virgisporangium aliadipatigenens]|uniref:Carboxypeptidase regulatory-like domain-containing protein n=1 Tax=Virgisporangium aliadipatigenens TaxID=741659 RepID=A0A8J3YWV6_9ACTN|nr:carboxypeptidase regulatory-like domain-containing protein [Virgisporangium aliadipatigenens]GIJ51997.1 hypothetical protein Val02_88830 [Virgisporangium aliadipatigenens]